MIFFFGILNVKVTLLLIFWFSQLKKIIYDANSFSIFRIIKRHETELKCFKLLQTPYPLGLNDNIYHECNVSKMPDFLLEFRKRKARSHVIKKNGNCKHKRRVQN